MRKLTLPWLVSGLLLALAAMTPGNASALTIFDDGGTHTIDAGNATPLMGYIVRDGPSGPTTVNVVGGTIGGTDFDSVLVEGSSIVNISGGTLLFGVKAEAGAPVINISGGTIAGGGHAALGGVINLTGGTVLSSFDAGDGGVINISGGTATEMDIFGGTVNIFGSGFNFPFGPIPLTARQSETVTGTLADGTPLNLGFHVYECCADTSAVVLILPVPSIPVMSPAGLLVFAAGLLGFIGYYRRRF